MRKNASTEPIKPPNSPKNQNEDPRNQKNEVLHTFMAGLVHVQPIKGRENKMNVPTKAKNSIQTLPMLCPSHFSAQ